MSSSPKGPQRVSGRRSLFTLEKTLGDLYRVLEAGVASENGRETPRSLRQSRVFERASDRGGECVGRRVHW